MKKSTKLVSAVVVLAVLGGTYVGLNTYVSKEEKTESSSEEESKTEVFSVKTDDIKSLEFIVDKKETTFEKKDDSWVKKDETAFPVNQTTLDSAASAIEKVEADRVLKKVDDLTEYGLDSPSNTVTVDTSDGTTKFNIGDENTSTNQYYISKDDDDSTVYVVAADTVTPFMKSLYDYAQGEDFPTIDSSTVKKVQVSEDKDSYVLEENSDGATWDVSSDGSSDKETADTTAAGNVTSGLGNFAYDQFVNYNAEDLSQYGLDKPYATITVDYQEEVKDDSSDSTDSSEKDSTASESDSESDSESVDSTDDKASAENSSTDSSDSTDASDDSSSSEDTKTTTVDKQLVIYVGDEASDGSRYVTVDNKHIYTMSADTLSAVIDKAPSDLWSLIVNYLSVKNLDQLQVTYGGATNTVNVSRETSKDDDGNDKETTTYQLDGKEIESTTFTTFYNKLINMAGQKRLTDAYTPATDPEMTAVFTDSDKNQTTVTFYTYDTNYYAAVVGNKVFLVNKMTVKEMFNAYETLINSESKTKATATPTAEAEN
jgi:hypothetical protein